MAFGSVLVSRTATAQGLEIIGQLEAGGEGEAQKCKAKENDGVLGNWPCRAISNVRLVPVSHLGGREALSFC